MPRADVHWLLASPLSPSHRRRVDLDKIVLYRILSNAIAAVGRHDVAAHSPFSKWIKRDPEIRVQVTFVPPPFESLLRSGDDDARPDVHVIA